MRLPRAALRSTASLSCWRSTDRSIRNHRAHAARQVETNRAGEHRQQHQQQLAAAKARFPQGSIGRTHQLQCRNDPATAPAIDSGTTR